MNTVWLITFTESVPVVIQCGIVFRRQDLMTCHEEADVIIIQQMVKAAESGVKRINIVCADTYVFVLLLQFPPLFLSGELTALPRSSR